MGGTAISKQALQRMPYYLQQLKLLQREGAEIATATMVAGMLRLGEVQVRKDFAAVCPRKGKPKTGFPLRELIENMELLLGYNSVKDAVLVGAGSLGRAFLSYDAFRDYGMNIAAAFDCDPKVTGRAVNGKEVLPMEALEGYCRAREVLIGIITCPASAAQEVCDRLVGSGILAIWNFAPAHLIVPENILVQDENMAASLALLSRHLNDKLESERRSARP